MNKCENENETIQEFCIILREREEEEDFKFMGPKAHYQIGLGPLPNWPRPRDGCAEFVRYWNFVGRSPKLILYSIP